MIKIDVISGFLGAGKTTLIKKLFTSKIKDEKVAIIENEFGEINIDSTFLKGSGVKINEINSGCICCTLVGNFSEAINDLVTSYKPNRIIIEPSGVGKLSDILAAIKNVGNDDLKLNIVATVVDGSKAKIQLKNFGEFFLDQIKSCDTIIVTKLEKVSNDYVNEIVDMIKANNEHANIITTDISKLESDYLLNSLEEKTSLSNKWLEDVILEAEYHHHHGHHCCHDEHHHDEHCSHHHDELHDHHCCHHDHDADEIFSSIAITTTKGTTKDEIESFLNKLKNDLSIGTILRSKGVLKAIDNEKWYYFDFVLGDYEIRLDEPDLIGKIAVIGSNLNEDKINELLKSF